VRWKLVWEFLEEYRWEPADIQVSLVGDERWDALLAAPEVSTSARSITAPSPLLDALRAFAGQAWTIEYDQAWRDAYDAMAERMLGHHPGPQRHDDIRRCGVLDAASGVPQGGKR
jgi:hypothetical protein